MIDHGCPYSFEIVKVKVAVVPEHIVVEPAIVATGNSRTVIVTAAELASPHAPFLITALYWVVAVMLVKLKVVVVFDTAVHVELPVGKYSHLTTEPVWPDTLTLPEFVPLHTVWAVEAVPPTEVASTVIFIVWPEGVELQFGVRPVVVISVKVTAVVPAVVNAGVDVVTV